MFKNDYFEVAKLSDESVLIMKRNGGLYKWGEKAVSAYCPAYYSEISPFLMVKYSDKTWSLCHAEAGPMPGATHIMEKEQGICPIEFQEDFLEEKEIKPKDSCFKRISMGLSSLGAVFGQNKTAQSVTENGIGDINVQHMTGADKNIENYEQMVGNLFVGQTMTPQKVGTHVGGISVVDNQYTRK
jgi:hypothetical protein